MYIWIVAVILFIIIEVLTTNLVTIWFAIGAFFAFLLSLFIDNLTLQIITFVIVSVIALILTRPLVKKYLKPNIIKTNYDRVIGEIGIVTMDINPNDVGEVKVDGKKWSAKADEKIKTGEKVKILNIDGVKLIVKKE